MTVKKFVEREIRRATGMTESDGSSVLWARPGGEVWKLEEQIYELLV